MELHGDVPRMTGQLGDLDELAVRRSTRDAHALFRERRLVEAVELETMAMALVNQVGAVDLAGERVRRQLAGVAAQAHRAAELVDAKQVAQLVDHFVRRRFIHFGGVGALQAADVAGVLDRRPLEAVADPEERDAVQARVLGGLHHAARAARPEAARDEDRRRAFEQARAALLLERFGFHPLNVDPHPVGKATVIQRLVQRLVGILIAGVLADDVNGDLVVRILDPLDQLFPRLHPRFARRQVQVFEDHRVEAFFAQRDRHFVNRRDIFRGDHRFFVDVAEQCDLLLDVARQRAIGAAQQDVRLDAD